MLLPCAGLPETNFASQGQAAFRDVPSLQLTPIEGRFDELAGHNRDRRSAFAVEQAQHHSRSRLADWCRPKQESSRAAVSKSGLQVDHDWTIGNFSDERECLIGIVARATVSARQRRVKNCGILRQR